MNEIAHLREILDERFIRLQGEINSLHTLLDERYETQTKALDAAFIAADKAVTTALDSADRAVSKAELAADKRFESVNEFRGQLTDQTARFITRDAFDALKERVDLMGGAHSGSTATRAAVIAGTAIVVTIAIAVVTLLVGN